jgi:hypothetical protein
MSKNNRSITTRECSLEEVKIYAIYSAMTFIMYKQILQGRPLVLKIKKILNNICTTIPKIQLVLSLYVGMKFTV